MNQYDSICESLYHPSLYHIRPKPFDSFKHFKSAEMFTMCGELFIFLFTSSIHEEQREFDPNCGYLFGLIMCLNRLLGSTHTIYSLDILQQDLAYYISKLQVFFPDFKGFHSVNFHLILHLTDQIKLFGPINGWWSMIYERLQFKLLEQIRSPKKPTVRLIFIFDIYINLFDISAIISY